LGSLGIKASSKHVGEIEPSSLQKKSNLQSFLGRI
jgi:hypothetical protein